MSRTEAPWYFPSKTSTFDANDVVTEERRAREAVDDLQPARRIVAVQAAAEQVAHAAQVSRDVVVGAKAEAQPAVQRQRVDEVLQVVLVFADRARHGVAGRLRAACPRR